MSFQNPPGPEIKRLIQSMMTIAVVGLSPNADRPSHGVARGMQRFGYKIIPVTPGQTELLGEKVYPDLLSLPGPVDLVDVFRSPEHVDAVVDQCLAQKLPALWLQEGVVNEKAALRAEAAGILVVMDRCIFKDYLLYMN